jgi:hypothetical protein
VRQVVTDNAEPGLATRGDDDRVLGASGWLVDAVSFGRDGNGALLVLELELIDLVEVGGVLETLDLDGSDVLVKSILGMTWKFWDFLLIDCDA